ncbi:MAG: hypothetical protein HKL99_14210 [Burkholderiales bacterium]|nr:hypothetical protein [Burkholderiales bacterium]
MTSEKQKKASKPVKSARVPGRVTFADAQLAKSLCGLTTIEFSSYFGWSTGTVAAMSKRPDEPLWSPAQSILARHVLSQPEQCVFPRKPNFKDTLKRINDSVDVESYAREFGTRRKTTLSGRRLILLMGMSLSAEHRLLRGTEPSPAVTRLLQTLNRMMDDMGAEAGFAKLVSLAREEAASRGMALSQVFEGNGWGVQDEIRARAQSGDEVGEDV